ncbi:MULTISPECIES: hypothetical protein [Arcobacteraceae]|uniref:DUF3649 domain-containing protein n=1 Tax=Aliarcobacter thereius LMG 24486 TaxID=1032240 RepID=A0A1C7WPH1_9BACT|nr:MULTISPECIES: hypothetical protein [Arcobacteraceae]OCL85312.1 hypothetical protein AAX30_01942 [Arcobacter porcinus]OCL94138.1 hypothetical protein AAX25_00469 [Aliarcobacter thereius]OCL95539.1 hypothetical protein AA347_01004 [Aliarcobacter thereius LMG 24486]QBF16474.1 putative membrane protein [Aliarcobacter thereius LMG 24486]TLS91532.1 hypothetical protein FE244_09010 [Aliarcobacter thereius]
MKQYINNLKIVEKSGKKIGLFRTICSIFGGLLLAYLGMTLLVFIIPGSAGESIVVPLLLNTFAWASVALWISLSKSKYIALLRCTIPSLIFSIILIILYNI